MEEARTIISGEQLQIAFQEQNWNELWPILQARAAYLLIKRYGIRSSRDEIKIWTRQLVQETLDLVFIKQCRKWNVDEYPQLIDFLKSVIDSHTNNTLKTKPKEAPTDNEYLLSAVVEATESVQDRISADELRKEILTELQELNADDDELLVFECLLDGIVKPENIRAELGISENDFHNIWRRVNRKREKLKTKLSKYGY
jgi:hypothetical protein